MSRAYLPKNQWDKIKEKLVTEVASIDVGPPEDLKNFVNAVIDENAFDKIASYVDFANDADDCDVVVQMACFGEVVYGCAHMINQKDISFNLLLL